MRLDTQTFQLKTTFHTSDTKQALAVLLIGDLAILFIPYLPLPSNLAVRELNTAVHIRLRRAGSVQTYYNR